MKKQAKVSKFVSCVFLFAAVLFLFFPRHKASAAIAFVRQATSSAGNVATLTVTLPANPAVGDALVASIGSQGVTSISGGGVT